MEEAHEAKRESIFAQRRLAASLSLDKNTYAVTDPVVATYTADAGGSTTDWIVWVPVGVVPAESTWSEVALWSYLNDGCTTACKTAPGTPSTSGVVTFDNDSDTHRNTQFQYLKEGLYDMYLMAEDAYVVLAGPITITYGVMTLTLDDTTITDAASDSLAVTYQNGEGVRDRDSTVKDWIAIYTETGYTDGDSSMQWSYLVSGCSATCQGTPATASTQGSVTFDDNSDTAQLSTWPLPVGNYKVYVLKDGGSNILMGPLALSIVAQPSAAPSLSPSSFPSR